MPFTVKANFIDIFKIGDNINFNLGILKVLYESYSILPEREKLIKPIVLLNTSIAEALLYDFIKNRIKYANGSERILDNIREALKSNKLDKFENYITQAEKYDLFEMKDTNFYDAMHSLRKKRNRIHIQNDKNIEPLDESKVFDEKIKILSEKVVEKILNTLSSKYPRREEYHDFVDDFSLPWDRHFPAPENLIEDPTLEEAQLLGII